MTTAVSYRAGTVPGALPLVGHGLKLRNSPLEFLDTLHRYGDLVEIRLGTQPAWVACHPDLVRTVLTDDRTYDKGGPLFDKMREVAGDGVGTCPHAEHRRQRRLVQPAFHRSRLPGYAEVMREETDVVTGGWREGEQVDIRRAMYQITLRTTTRTMFAADIPDEHMDAVRHSTEVTLNGAVERVVAPLGVKEKLPLPSNTRYKQARAHLLSTIDAIIAQEHRSDDLTGDILSVLIAARDEGGDKLNTGELRDTTMALLIGGSDTTSALLSWTFHLLGQHPEIAERLRAESDAVLGGGSATYEDLPKLPFTHQVLREAMRLYPPLWLVTRILTKDTELGGHPLKADSIIVYSPYVLHRHPGFYERPTSFEPERWVDDGQERRLAKQGIYIPFGLGARQCIGNEFGMTEAILTLSTIVGRWRFEPASGETPKPMKMATILHPESVPMRVYARG